MIPRGNSCILLFITVICFVFCQRASNLPVDGSKLSVKENYTYKMYPFQNIQGLKDKSESLGEVDYAMLDKTENIKFNLNKSVSVGYIKNYYHNIEYYENNNTWNNNRLIDRYDLDRFQEVSYIPGNGQILIYLRDNLNEMSIPDYIDSYFNDLRKYVKVEKDIKKKKNHNIAIKNSEYWTNLYHLNEPEQKKVTFHEKEFNYYQYLKQINGE